MHLSEHVEVNSFLLDLEYPYRMPILQTRKLLFEAHPKIYESIIRGNLLFSINNEELCVIKVVKNSVRLIFLNGASLEDPNKILMSFGLKSRCVELYDADSSIFIKLQEYVEQAVGHLLKSMEV